MIKALCIFRCITHKMARPSMTTNKGHRLAYFSSHPMDALAKMDSRLSLDPNYNLSKVVQNRDIKLLPELWVVHHWRFSRKGWTATCPESYKFSCLGQSVRLEDLQVLSGPMILCFYPVVHEESSMSLGSLQNHPVSSGLCWVGFQRRRMGWN